MPIRRACLASPFAAGCVIRAVPSSEAARERLGDSQLPSSLSQQPAEQCLHPPARLAGSLRSPRSRLRLAPPPPTC